MAGQAHILVGFGLLLLSFPLNEMTPNPVFAIAALAGCGLGAASCSAMNSFLKYRRDELVALEKEGAWYE